jgi:hypothetical protein
VGMICGGDVGVVRTLERYCAKFVGGGDCEVGFWECEGLMRRLYGVVEAT